MARSLKIKIGIAGFAIFVLILIPLLEVSFFAPVVIKKWSKLSWDDFRGIPQPFSSYGAAISSSVYLEYDSAVNRYIAYAGQNNRRSWVKRNLRNPERGLHHEQYHFNITELHARLLNNYIEANPNGTLESYHARLNSINRDLNRMQDRYDDETNHSLVYDKQRNWEFRIDSLLTLQKGWVTDHFSGAQVYFTQLPDSLKGIVNGFPYRQYTTYKYGMELSLSSYHAPGISLRSTTESFKLGVRDRSERLISFSLDTVGTLRAFAISKDTSNQTDVQLWVKKEPYLYRLKARYRNDMGDTTGYSQIAFSFINSFRVVDTDSYWVAKLGASDSPILFSTAVKGRGKKGRDGESCMTVGPSKQQGFRRGPFYRDDGAMILAYDYLVHPDTLHFKDVLLLNSDWYSQTPTPEGQIFFVPAQKIPKQKFTIMFGYSLLQDSVKECYEFHHETLEITP